VKGTAVAYCAVGSLILYSGVKGATIQDTVKGVLSGNLALSDTEGISPSASSPSSSPSAPASGGPVATGTELQRGTTLYSFFRANGYSPIQAAGAIASIHGESSWNPDDSGTGGRGLIGWSPPSTLPDSAFTGNTAADMAAQMPLILDFVNASGDQGAVTLMAGATTITQAAQIWDSRVERAGINDVHPDGVSKAAQIAKAVDGVTLQEG
jgi:hypothetical protein